MRYLVKPVIAVLVGGLIGCASTKYTPLALNTMYPEDSLAADASRVILLTDETLDLVNVVLSPDSVKGWNPGRRGEPFAVATEDVRQIEMEEVAGISVYAATDTLSFPAVRLTLTSGNTYELADAVVTPEGVSGRQVDAGSLSIPHDQILRIQLRHQEIHKGRTVAMAAALAAVPLALFATWFVGCVAPGVADGCR
jgi:hypothetical protein